MRNPRISSPQHSHRKPRLTTADKIALIKRLEAGETRAVVAKDARISRQYVSLIWKAYQAQGESALVTSPRMGRKKSRELNEEQVAELFHLVQTQKASDLKLSVHLYGDFWCVDTAREWIQRRFHFLASRRYLTELFEGWGLPPMPPNPIELEMSTPEFHAYLKSPIAQQIREREKACYEQMNREAEERIRRLDQAFRDEMTAPSRLGDQASARQPVTAAGKSPTIRPPHSSRTGKHAKGGARRPKTRRKGDKGRKR
ncbi:MAG TPA: helix-turn-helix domain-containing protein [Verrucomicrobiales bacterium]|nr:helix-turn-helix domain-containing protein [Verrucomicrobiales bacterium]